MMRRALSLALAALVAVIVAAGPAGATNDPFFDQQWAVAKMHVVDAWSVTRGAGIIVAVVDSGVDLKHPDLQAPGKLLPGRDFVDNDTDPQDANGHGTHMAGTIGAVTGNGVGIASVAPGVQILPVRVLGADGTSSDPASVAAGIKWAADNGARVINLSLAQDGKPGGVQVLGNNLFSDTQIDDAINYSTGKGAVVVIAAGNNDTGGQSQTAYTATSAGAIVVGASTDGDKRAKYSNYGPGLDVLAPGGGSATDASFDTGCTQKNAIVGLYWDPKTKSSAYAGACGTSVSVAQVSGLAALLVAKGYSNDDAVKRIKQTAIDLGAKGRDDETGYGRVDAARALGAPTSTRPIQTSGGAAPSPPSGGRRVGGAGATASPLASPKSSSGSPDNGNGKGSPGSLALGPTTPAKDRSTPIAVASVLAFFTAWGWSGARRLVVARRSRVT